MKRVREAQSLISAAIEPGRGAGKVAVLPGPQGEGPPGLRPPGGEDQEEVERDERQVSRRSKLNGDDRHQEDMEMSD
ncbi:hypothetical protein XENOCAPTIV_029940 [Xenoophorus captivus]|uniref:Uncharacterized protein n=1 Tax=Xenoophorus captivus TaxID=1517983 RepID=A0ABV0RG77_9TELE